MRSCCVRQSGERILFESFQIRSAGIDRDAMRFQGLGAILLWLAHLASISHNKPRHCAAVTKPSSTRKHRSNAPTLSLFITSFKKSYCYCYLEVSKDLQTNNTMYGVIMLPKRAIIEHTPMPVFL